MIKKLWTTSPIETSPLPSKVSEKRLETTKIRILKIHFFDDQTLWLWENFYVDQRSFWRDAWPFRLGRKWFNQLKLHVNKTHSLRSDKKLSCAATRDKIMSERFQHMDRSSSYGHRWSFQRCYWRLWGILNDFMQYALEESF